MLLIGSAYVPGVLNASAQLDIVADSTPKVSFTAPETIWLRLGTSDTMEQFSPINNSSNTFSSDVVSFSCPQASSVTIAAKNLTTTSQTASYTGSSWTLSSGNKLGTITVDTANSGVVIEWTATYSLSGYTGTYTSKAYSYMYRPSELVAGAGSEAIVDYSPTYAGSILSVMGLHSINDLSTNSSWYYRNGDGDWSASDCYYLRRENDTLVSHIKSNSFQTSQARPINCYMTTGTPYTYPYAQDNETTLGGDNCTVKSYNYNAGAFIYDSSRFSNVGKVPGLIFSHIVTDMEAKGSNDDYADVRVGTTDGDATYFTKTGWKGDWVPCAELNWNVRTPTSTSITEATNTVTIGSYTQHIHDIQGGDDDNAKAQNRVTFNLTKYTSADLRARVLEAETYSKRVPDSLMANATTFYSQLQAAVTELGKPTTTTQASPITLTNAVAASAVSQVAPVVYFTAPEVIYLTPSNATSGTVNAQYFVGSTFPDQPTSATWGTMQAASNATTGEVFFRCDVADGGVKITCEDASSDIVCTARTLSSQNWTSSGTYTDIATNIGDAGADGANHGGNYRYIAYRIGQGCKFTNTSHLIRWRAKYYVGGVEYIAYAYSYVYKPFTDIFGAAIHSNTWRNGSDGNYIAADIAAWAMGVHDVTTETISNTALTTTAAGTKHVDANIASGSTTWANVAVGTDPGLTTTTGRYIYDYQTSGTYHYRSMLSEGNTTTNDSWTWLYLSRTDTGKSGGSFAVGSINDNRGTGEGRAAYITSPIGKIWVDASRYENLQDVPNLKYNFASTAIWGESNSNGQQGLQVRRYVGTSTTPNSKLSQTFLTFDGIGDDGSSNGGAAGEAWYIKDNYFVQLNRDGSANRIWINGGAGMISSSSSYNIFNFNLKDTTLFTKYDTNTQIRFWAKHVGYTSYGDKDCWNDSIPIVAFNLNLVDKTNLRKQLQEETMRSLQKRLARSDWAAYETAMNNLATALCKPDYALTSTEAAENTADTSLAYKAKVAGNNCYNDYTTSWNCHLSTNPGLGSTDNDHKIPKSDSTNWGGTNNDNWETVTWSYDQLVLGGKVDIPGYTYLYHISPAATGYDGSASKYVNSASAYSYDSTYDTNPDSKGYSTANSTSVFAKGDALVWKFYYQPITYKVKYDFNGGTGSPTHTYSTTNNGSTSGTSGNVTEGTSYDLYYDSPYTVAAVGTLQKSGWTFQGWQRTDTGAMVSGSVNRLTASSGTTITLQAVWKDTTVPTISANGVLLTPDGTSGYYAYFTATDAQSGMRNVQVPTWDNGSQPDDSVNSNGQSLTGYTDWTKQECKYFQASLTTGSTYRFTVLHDDKVDGELLYGIKSTGLLEVGLNGGYYVSHGYAYDNTGNSSSGAGQATVYFPKVTFNLQGGTNNSEGPESVVAGSGKLAFEMYPDSYNAANPANTYSYLYGFAEYVNGAWEYATALEPSKTGYTFTGWSFTANQTAGNKGLEVRANNGNADTVYACWQANPYNLIITNGTGGTLTVPTATGRTFSPTGNTIASATVKTVTQVCDTVIDLSTITLTPAAGYKWSGWTDKTGNTWGTGTNADKYTYKPNGGTVKANWLLENYTLAYDSNGGTEIASLTGQHYQDAYTIPDKPVRQGYAFLGWFAQDNAAGDNGTGTEVTAATKFADLADGATVTIYAKWASDTTPPKVHLLSQDTADAQAYFNAHVLPADQAKYSILPTTVLVGHEMPVPQPYEGYLNAADPNAYGKDGDGNFISSGVSDNSYVTPVWALPASR
ncbi:MAG: InlB B-repeat-containing protein, partial [Oscillospiraceae bacterium]|nr:InlB B-repeat-containing protein [Oscillospiraceae bacterium]